MGTPWGSRQRRRRQSTRHEPVAKAALDTNLPLATLLD
jgi:hypothetical protein